MSKLILLSLLMMALGACKQCKPDEPQLQAGVSAAIINPPLGAFIAGDKQNRRFTGVHDSLYAKAIVFVNGDEKIALVTLDCIGLLYPDVLRIRRRAAELCAFPEERIIVTSTHTHSGPDVVGIWGSDYQHSGVDSSYMAFLINTAAEQVQKAWDTRRYASVSATETTFGEPWVQNICNEEIDRTVSILHLIDKQNKPIATLTNFACHPTYMDAKFTDVSADYIHGYYTQLKKRTGGEALFLQGAIGGWVQPVDGEGSFEKAFDRGSELAGAVINALPKAVVLTSSTISFDRKQIKLPVENANWKQLADIGTIKRNISDSVQTEISWFALGDVQFATHPGETAPYYGLETRKMMKTGPKFIIGLGNDALGYIVKPSFFEDDRIPHAEYLTSMSLGKQTGPLMMKHLRAIVPSSGK